MYMYSITAAKIRAVIITSYTEVTLRTGFSHVSSQFVSRHVLIHLRSGVCVYLMYTGLTSYLPCHKAYHSKGCIAQYFFRTMSHSRRLRVKIHTSIRIVQRTCLCVRHSEFFSFCNRSELALKESFVTRIERTFHPRGRTRVYFCRCLSTGEILIA